MLNLECLRRPRACRSVALSLLVFLLSGRAGAQVNVEPLRAQIGGDGVGARFSASVASYAGNTRGIVFGGSALAGGRSGRHFAYANLTGDYAALNATVSVAKWFLHARYNYAITEAAFGEVFGQLESDRFRSVELRQLVGIGPRFALFQSDDGSLYLGTSYMLEYTRLNSGDEGLARKRTLHRWNNYLAVNVRPDERILLSSVGYFQPRFDEFSDYHVLSISSVGFKITNRLQSRLDCTVRYESVHPDDVEGADLELKSALELVF